MMFSFAWFQDISVVGNEMHIHDIVFQTLWHFMKFGFSQKDLALEYARFCQEQLILFYKRAKMYDEVVKLVRSF